LFSSYALVHQPTKRDKRGNKNSKRERYMGEVAYMDEGDLEAIVRGYSGSGDAFSGESSGTFSPSFCLPMETSSFYEPEMETSGLDELGELYKPFYPFSTQTILTSSVSLPEDSKPFRDDKKQRSHGCLLSNGSRADHIRISESKSKKRSVFLKFFKRVL
jgi:WRKY transcription factor 29